MVDTPGGEVLVCAVADDDDDVAALDELVINEAIVAVVDSVVRDVASSKSKCCDTVDAHAPVESPWILHAITPPNKGHANDNWCKTFTAALASKL